MNQALMEQKNISTKIRIISDHIGLDLFLLYLFENLIQYYSIMV